MNWWNDLFSCCGCEHPGGFELVKKAAMLCEFQPQHQLLDVAAGNGETVRRLRELIGCTITGLDCDLERVSKDVCFGDAAAMPFGDEVFDGVLIECSLSQMQDAGKALSECHRVLKAGGKLILTDLYARKGGRSENTMLGRLDSEETIRQRLGAQKFSVQLFEDASQLLTEFWASALMSGRGDQLYQKMRIDEGLKSCQCGYYLCIAERQ